MHAFKSSIGLTSHINFGLGGVLGSNAHKTFVGSGIEPAQQLRGRYGSGGEHHTAQPHNQGDFHTVKMAKKKRPVWAACLNVLDGESLVDAFGRQVTLGVEGGHTTGTRGGHRLTVDVVCSIARNKYPLTVGLA